MYCCTISLAVIMSAVTPSTSLQVMCDSPRETFDVHQTSHCGATRNDVQRPRHVTGKPVSFVHIHKAAGTFMCQLARMNLETTPQYPPDYACNDRADTFFKWDPPWLYDAHGSRTPQASVSCAERLQRNITWFQIEREFNDEDLCEGMFQYGVLLREPIKFLESWYNFMFFDSWWTVPHFFSNISHLPDNYMVRALGGRDVKAVPRGGINATHLARAMNVLKKFTTVARVEDLGNAALEDKFRRDFGWHTFKLNMTLLHAMYPNQTDWPLDDENQHVHHKNFTQQDISKLEELNKYDIMLYNSVEPVK